MPQKWSHRGAIASLFDRLSDLEPQRTEEPSDAYLQNEEAMRLSIQKECLRILNTRCMLNQKEYSSLEPDAAEFRFPRFFGLPDDAQINPRNSTDAHRIERVMAKTIEIFEPRLHNVRVEIQRYEEPFQSLYLAVGGDLKIGDVITPITFPVILQDFKDQGERESIAYDQRPRIELN